MDNWIYLVLAYSVAWLGILLYVYYNSQKLADIEMKIREIESTIQRTPRP
jgi:CcmD family protein